MSNVQNIMDNNAFGFNEEESKYDSQENPLENDALGALLINSGKINPELIHLKTFLFCF